MCDERKKTTDERFCKMMKCLLSMTESSYSGKKGEDVASQFLVNKGYKLLARNWQYMHRELDIVAIHQKTLVFVEVKTRMEGSLIAPQEAVNKKKQRLLVSAANLYIQKHDLNFESRFDIISVIYSQHSFRIEHIENAFYPNMI